MNLLFLEPSDVLFFRDGRPMGGASSGHGAAWPLPTVTSAALHAALHRSDLPAHLHRHNQQNEQRNRRFGSLVQAGPFPVHRPSESETHWYFPRPLDLLDDTLRPAQHPLELDAFPADSTHSSLQNDHPWLRPMTSTLPPAKERPARAWLAQSAYQRYLDGHPSSTPLTREEACNDAHFSGTEFSYGIGLDATTGTQDKQSFYSAQYLRLRASWALGIIAATQEKQPETSAEDRLDLIPRLFPDHGHIVVGGQQRVCATTCRPTATAPLPRGRHERFAQLSNGKFAVKWVLLSPALFPALGAENRVSKTPHPGGWLPSWIEPRTGEVQLLDGPGPAKAKRQGVNPGQPIRAHLVGALIGKPVVVTGWALAHAEAERDTGGAKPTQLAVPAGSVYYFEADTAAAAHKLAEALNWHGPAKGQSLQNRRSALLGEKGFGLGVCATWYSHPSTAQS